MFGAGARGNLGGGDSDAVRVVALCLLTRMACAAQAILCKRCHDLKDGPPRG